MSRFPDPLRQLQKLFERRGTTITGWIRERRLERCRRDLGDWRLVDRSAAAVAASWGLIDAAQFRRAYRARYGTTPRAHRAELTGTTSCGPVVLAQEMGAQTQAWRNERKQAHLAARPGRCHHIAEEIDS